MQNLAALNSLRLCLEFHAAPDLFRWFDVFNFIAQNLETPILSCLVQSSQNISVKVVSFFESAVQL